MSHSGLWLDIWMNSDIPGRWSRSFRREAFARNIPPKPRHGLLSIEGWKLNYIMISKSGRRRSIPDKINLPRVHHSLAWKFGQRRRSIVIDESGFEFWLPSIKFRSLKWVLQLLEDREAGFRSCNFEAAAYNKCCGPPISNFYGRSFSEKVVAAAAAAVISFFISFA